MQTRIAILDEMLAAQLAENPEGFEELEVVWSGTDLDALRREIPAKRPHVLVCALSLLGEEPQATMDELEREASSDLSIVVYHFAKRSDLDRLREERGARRLVKAPVALGALRTQMMSVLVRNALAAGPRRAPEADAPLPGADPLYTQAQLGRLAEVTSSIDCECPNHLAQLVSSLTQFEEYSKQCESKGDEDAAIHRMLWHETRRARTRMEDALARLVEHEDIEL